MDDEGITGVSGNEVEFGEGHYYAACLEYWLRGRREAWIYLRIQAS